MGQGAARIDPPPVSVVVFGSFARGEADSESDIDVVVVRGRGVDEDDPAWRETLDRWREYVSRVAGNNVELLEISEEAVSSLLRTRKPLWGDVQRDGVVVFGSPLTVPKGRRSA